MNKIIFYLVIILVIFVGGCTKKTDELDGKENITDSLTNNQNISSTKNESFETKANDTNKAKIVEVKKCKPTGQDVEGPFYRTGTPFKNKISPINAPGEKLIIHGLVLDTSCNPIGDAIIDIWQTDANGKYDASNNYLYRGKVKTSSDGIFEFETIRPGNYPLGNSFRPAHIHIKASNPGYKLVTTQLYFTDDKYLAPNDPCSECGSEDYTHIIELNKDTKNNAWEGVFDIVLEYGSEEGKNIATYN